MAARTFRGSWSSSDGVFANNSKFLVLLFIFLLVARWDDPDPRIAWFGLGGLLVSLFFAAPWIHTLTITDDHLTWRIMGVRAGHARWDQMRSLSADYCYAKLVDRRLPVWYGCWGHLFLFKTPGLADAILVQLKRHPHIATDGTTRDRLVRASARAEASRERDYPSEKPPGARWDL